MVIACADILVISWLIFSDIHVRLSLHVTNDSSSSGVHVIQVSEIYRI